MKGTDHPDLETTPMAALGAFELKVKDDFLRTALGAFDTSFAAIQQFVENSRSVGREWNASSMTIDLMPTIGDEVYDEAQGSWAPAAVAAVLAVPPKERPRRYEKEAAERGDEAQAAVAVVLAEPPPPPAAAGPGRWLWAEDAADEETEDEDEVEQEEELSFDREEDGDVRDACTEPQTQD